MTQFRSVPSRRAVVFGLTAISLPVLPIIASVYQCRWMSSPSRRQSRRLARKLVDAGASSRRSAARIGRQYLHMVPEEKNINSLLALIERQLLDRKSFVQGRSIDDIQDAIAKTIEKDFACGRICQVKGWILSRTEARIAGLAAMI